MSHRAASRDHRAADGKATDGAAPKGATGPAGAEALTRVSRGHQGGDRSPPNKPAASPVSHEPQGGEQGSPRRRWQGHGRRGTGAPEGRACNACRTVARCRAQRNRERVNHAVRARTSRGRARKPFLFFAGVA